MMPVRYGTVRYGTVIETVDPARNKLLPMLNVFSLNQLILNEFEVSFTRVIHANLNNTF